MFDDFEYAASDGMIKSYWNANYTLIHKANDVLEEMKSNPSLTGGDLVNKGEALLMRAFCYFNLVRAFGEVPLIDFKVGSVADANIPKSSVDQIYTLIDEDLTNAESYLPRTWEKLAIMLVVPGLFNYMAGSLYNSLGSCVWVIEYKFKVPTYENLHNIIRRSAFDNSLV